MVHTIDTTDTSDGLNISFDAFKAGCTDSLSRLCSTLVSSMYFILSSHGVQGLIRQTNPEHTQLGEETWGVSEAVRGVSLP